MSNVVVTPPTNTTDKMSNVVVTPPANTTDKMSNVVVTPPANTTNKKSNIVPVTNAEEVIDVLKSGIRTLVEKEMSSSLTRQQSRDELSEKLQLISKHINTLVHTHNTMKQRVADTEARNQQLLQMLCESQRLQQAKKWLNDYDNRDADGRYDADDHHALSRFQRRINSIYMHSPPPPPPTATMYGSVSPKLTTTTTTGGVKRKKKHKGKRRKRKSTSPQRCYKDEMRYNNNNDYDVCVGLFGNGAVNKSTGLALHVQLISEWMKAPADYKHAAQHVMYHEITSPCHELDLCQRYVALRSLQRLWCTRALKIFSTSRISQHVSDVFPPGLLCFFQARSELLLSVVRHGFVSDMKSRVILHMSVTSSPVAESTKLLLCYMRPGGIQRIPCSLSSFLSSKSVPRTQWHSLWEDIESGALVDRGIRKLHFRGATSDEQDDNNGGVFLVLCPQDISPCYILDVTDSPTETHLKA